MENFRDDSHSKSKGPEKALTKALRRLPTGGWDSRSSRQSLSALFTSPAAQSLPFSPTSAGPQRKIDRRKAVKFTELAIALPDVRAQRVAELKARVKAGSYRVDSADLATKMIED